METKHTEISINSKRKYKVQISDSDGAGDQRLTVNRLLNVRPDEYEYIYAMHDIIDDILDLKIGDSIYFQPNRDQKNSKGIITRTE